jgi:hypothetical protein
MGRAHPADRARESCQDGSVFFPAFLSVWEIHHRVITILELPWDRLAFGLLHETLPVLRPPWALANVVSSVGRVDRNGFYSFCVGTA